MLTFRRSTQSSTAAAKIAPPSAACRRILESRRGRALALAPLVIGVLALATLAVVPWTVNAKLARVRLNMSATLLPARQLVRDLADALALEAATRSYDTTRSTPELVRRYTRAVAIERARDADLGVLAPHLGDRLAGDIARLHTLIAQWHAARERTAGEMTITDFLAVAQRLDAALAERQAAQRARVQSLEALDILLPSVLVPLLAAVLVAISWTGRQMAALAREAEQSRHALSVAAEQKVTLLRGLTHDLKNALGAAGGFTTLLRDEVVGPLTTRQRHSVERIGHIIEQTMVAVGDALLVARTEAGALPVRYRTEDGRTLILEAAADYVATAERAGLTLDVDCADDVPAIDTDGPLVSKIIGNLLSNAIKYTPAGGRIWVRSVVRASRDGSERGPWIVIEVRDTGPGIPVALHEQVFDEFFRAPSAASSTHGEGIGLAMSRRVARLLGGEITLDSEEGRGAAFTLWLPARARETGHLPSRADVVPRLDENAYDRRHAIQ
jgi:signal transduction histidine kinase